MRKLLSVIALFSVIAIASAFSNSSANAMVLTTDVHALKAEQAGVAEKTAVRCWWHNGRRHCTTVHRRRHCWWRNGRRICRW